MRGGAVGLPAKKGGHVVNNGLPQPQPQQPKQSQQQGSKEADTASEAAKEVMEQQTSAGPEQMWSATPLEGRGGLESGAAVGDGGAASLGGNSNSPFFSSLPMGAGFGGIIGTGTGSGAQLDFLRSGGGFGGMSSVGRNGPGGGMPLGGGLGGIGNGGGMMSIGGGEEAFRMGGSDGFGAGGLDYGLGTASLHTVGSLSNHETLNPKP